MCWCAQAANEIYAVLDKGTMTLYYDDQKASRSGEDDWVNNWNAEKKESVKEVMFDYSIEFYGAKPTSTKSWFADMNYLEKIYDIDYLNTSEVTDMSRMFSDCESLEELDLRTFNTSKVTNMSAMFSECTHLESLDVSTWNTYNVTDMSEMFNECYSLENLNLNSFETDNVTDMTGMFANCDYLRSLFLKHWEVSKVVSFNQMFYGCGDIESLDLSTWETSAAEDMEGMFEYCSGLYYLYINKFVSTSLKNADKMFFGCYSLQRIYCDNDFSGVASSTEMFSGCGSLIGYQGTEYDSEKTDGARAHLDGGEGNEGYFSAKPDFYAALADDGVTLTFYFDYQKSERGGYTVWNIPALQSSVTKVVIDPSVRAYPIVDMSKFFMDYIELREIDNFDNFDCSITSDMSQMFRNCPLLEEVDLSDTYAYKVMNMSYMFYGCHRLEKIDLSNFHTEIVSEMSHMFDECVSLRELILSSDFNTRNVVNFNSMFSQCASLKSFDLSGFDMSSAEDVAAMFYACTSLRHIELGHLDLRKAEYMFSMFHDCSSLETLDLSEVETENAVYMYAMFSGCTSLQSIHFGGYFLTGNVEDMSGMFYNCSSLTELHLDYLNTDNVKVFGDDGYGGMFEGCSSLKVISMPYFYTWSATDSKNMFAGCSELERIYCYYGDFTSVTNSDNMFDGCYKLEGFKGTVFDDTKTDKTYAHVDGGTGDEGYFSVLPELYAVMDGATINFYYDSKMAERGGSDMWDVSPYNEAEKAHFDESVKYYRPHYIIEMFKDFSKLKEIENLGYLNLEDATDFKSVFYGCSSLESIDLTCLDTRHIIDMSILFENCSSLKSVNMNGMNTSSLASTFEMFSGCTSLEEVWLRGWNTSKLEDASGMFRNCSSLKTIDLSDFTIDNLRNVYDPYSGGMFEGCSSLTTIAWPVDFTTNAALMSSKTDDLFKGCDNLKGGKGTEFDPAVIDITYAQVDGGSGDEGYFSEYELYGVYDPEGTYMTLYYDGKMDERGGDPYYSWSTDAKTIELDESVKNERLTSTNWLFAVFNKLEEIKHLEYLNTSMVTDMRAMFYACNSLKSLDLSSFDTRNVTDMSSMFFNCRSLESIDLSSFDTRKVTDMSDMFLNCQSLKSLDLSKFDTRNVENMYSLFGGCSALESLDISKFDTRNVEDMRYMFYECYALASLDLSHFNTANVTTMEGMFDYCEGLESVDVSKFNTAKVKNMEWMFAECLSLKSLDLSSFNTKNVQSMQGMFNHCPSLKSLSIDHFSTDALEYTAYMFQDNPSLEKIYCTNDWNLLSSISSSEYMFAGCEQLAGNHGTVYDEDKTDLIYARPDGGEGDEGYFSAPGKLYAVVEGTKLTLYFDDLLAERGGVSAWQLPEIQGTVTEVELDKSMTLALPASTQEWFLDFTELTQITHLDYLNTNELRSAESMFSGCEKLTELDLSSFTTYKLTNIQKMFNNCSSLTALYSCISWNIDGIQKSDGAFDGCTALVGGKGTIFDNAHTDKEYARIDGGTGDEGYFTGKPTFYALFNDGEKTLSFFYDEQFEKRAGKKKWSQYYSRTEKVVFDESVKDYRPTTTKEWFYYFYNLEEISHLDYLNTSEVTDMSLMFYNCQTLKALDVSKFNTAKVENMYGIFCDCQALETLDVSGFNTANVTTMRSMFNRCYKLASIDVSHFNTEKVTSMSHMFREMSALEELDLSAFKTDKVEAMAYMFYKCPLLKELDLSNFNTENVTDMINLFSGCEALESLDISSFNTKKVTNMDGMFNQCSALTALNINNFDIDALESSNSMFQDCPLLKTIYCNKDWSASVKLTKGDDMFAGCLVLEGGKGTVFDAGKVDKSFARQDGGTGDEGYFTESKTFTVNFYNKAGEVAKTQEVETYNPAYAPELAPLTGYTFKGWDKEFAHVMEDLEVHPIYEADKIDVIFYEKDGSTEIEKQVIDYEQHATAPAAPAAAEGYHFAGWLSSLTSEVMSSDEVNAAIVTAAVTYTAQYAINTYKVVFVAENGEIASDPVIADMDKVEHGTELTLTATPDEGYDFVKWTNYDGTKLVVTSDTTITAAFKIQTFTVIFQDENGTELKKETVEYGNAATAPENPTKEGWTFAGWDKAFNVVKSDLTVTATYTKNPVYTVTFLDYDESVIAEVKVEEGKDAVAPDDPIREGYHFTGWDKAFNNVTEDITVTAKYAINTYTVIFLGFDDVKLGEQVVEHGQDAPGVIAPKVEGYIFIGWDTDYTNVTSDLTVKAVYEKDLTPQNLKVTQEDKDGDQLITLSWDKVDGVPSYELKVLNGEDELFTSNTFGENVVEKTLSELVKKYGIKPGTYTIHWAVRSTNIMGIAVSEWAIGEDFTITVKDTGTGVENMVGPASAISIQKVLRDGHVYIIRDGKTYMLNGQMVK